MTRDLFDRRLRALRRDRAARIGPELFLLDRAFDECLDRLRDIARPFDRALLLGCPSTDWPRRLHEFANCIDAYDPGEVFAQRCAGQQLEEDRHDFGEACFDLVIAVGTLDTVNDLPLALHMLRRSLKADAPLIGAMAGGNSLPVLRASLIEAGRSESRVVARTHPRIDPSTLAQLLASAGLRIPVVDIDRMKLRYESFDAMVRDLRAMGATNMLAGRPPPLSRDALARARQDFASHGLEGRTTETVEILHFIAWA